MTTIIKPAAKLDGSLLLARKGEAMPAVAANEHNNPSLAWGAPAHPTDFQPRMAVDTVASKPVHHDAAHHVAAHLRATAPMTKPTPSVRPVAQHQPPTVGARLRPDSFMAAEHHAQKAAPVKVGTPPDRDPVAMTVRVEDETYLRLRYLAQTSGRSPQQVLSDALDQHLRLSGVTSNRKLVIKPE